MLPILLRRFEVKIVHSWGKIARGANFQDAGMLILVTNSSSSHYSSHYVFILNDESQHD